MNSVIGVKAWLAEFLLTRGLTKPALDKPLYAYEVTEQEYKVLIEAIKSDKHFILHPVMGAQWSACFCMFVAERYRREYDATEGGWSWQGFEKIIESQLTPPKTKQVVTQGLGFWNRPIRNRTNGADYLGSLFMEGGLPWPLLRSESHCFGRTIKSSIKSYEKTKRSGINLIDLIRDHQQSFPKAFRQSNTFVILASIVESLMRLASTHNLDNQDDPASYLDKHQPNWRNLFPLPIGEKNAKALVNEWLRNAGVKQRELNEIEDETRSFTCQHVLQGELSDWTLETTIYLPKEYVIKSNETILSTRLEFVFFEGDERVLGAGILYGKLDENHMQISVSFPKKEYKIRRKQPEEPLTLQFLSNGMRVEVVYLQDSDIDISDSPLIFESGEERTLIANSSAIIAEEAAWLRCPPMSQIDTHQDSESLDKQGARWYKITSDVSVKLGNALFTIRFRDGVSYEKPILKGKLSLYDTLPRLTYYGVPVVKFPDYIEQEGKQVVTLLNDRQYQASSICGSYLFRAKLQDGENLLTKKVGILPPDLMISSFSATRETPARIHLYTQEVLSISVGDKTLRAEVMLQGEHFNIVFHPQDNVALPSMVEIAVKSENIDCMPVVLCLPYPQQGVALIDDKGDEVGKHDIAIDELLGMRMQLTSSTAYRQDFYMVMDLLTSTGVSLRRIYKYNIFKQSLSISMYSFYDDLMQMLSTVPDQDAIISIKIETNELIRQFQIKRYMGALNKLERADLFEIISDETNGSIQAIGINLVDPAQKEVPIPQYLSAGILTGTFTVPKKMQTGGPWLITASKDSSVSFRPCIWLTADMDDEALPYSGVAESLHTAAKIYHPENNPNVFDAVISFMSTDLLHSGWQYLINLKDNFSFLPLSVFYAWRALTHNSQSLAIAVIRLELTSEFCKKFINDLAVIWEEITVDEWRNAVILNHENLKTLGIPELAIDSIIRNRLESVGSIIPAIKHFLEYITREGDENIKSLPVEYLYPDWYQSLRQRHADDEEWPELLDWQLSEFISQLDNSEVFMNVVNMKYERAVVFFPIFMAYLSAGEFRLSGLKGDYSEIRFAIRVLSDFDRDAWYEPVYALVLSNLIAKIIKERK